MPSLFSKFKKRSSISSPSSPNLTNSRTSTDFSPPTSPRKSYEPSSPTAITRSVVAAAPASGQGQGLGMGINTQANINTDTNITTTSMSGNVPASPTPRSSGRNSFGGGASAANREAVVTSSSASPRSATILHEQPPPVPDFSAGGPSSASGAGAGNDYSSSRFSDERHRPDLPTTSSNLHNPQPNPNSLSWQGDSNSNSTGNKALPTLPEASPALPLLPGQGDRHRDLGYSVKDGTSHQRVREHAPRLPPLPHIGSINTAHLSSDYDQPRPDAVPSTSHVGSRAQTGQPQFHHVHSISPQSQPQSRSGATSAAAAVASAVGAATTSRRPGEADRTQRQGFDTSDIIQPSQNTRSRQRRGSKTSSISSKSSDSHYDRTPAAGQPADRNIFDRSTVQARDNSGISPLDAHLAALSFGVGPQAAHTSSTPFKIIHDPDALPLEEQRSSLIDRIAGEARERKQADRGLTEAGQAVFAQVGWEERVGRRGEVEVRTKYLEPIVQQNIIRKEHTEYTTIIERCVHKTHIYPIIQPIHDPDPIVHPTRHRFFDPTTKKWHEVIGDEAAIAIIGEDAFRNGPKSFREERKLALPGFGGPLDPLVSRGVLVGSGAGGSRGMVQPVQRRDGGLEGDAYRARVVEREGVEGNMGDWTELSTGKKLLEGLRGDRKEIEAVGEVDGLVRGLGEKTARIAI